MPAARKEPPKLPEDSRLVKKWRDLLDPQKTSIRDFCAFYKVPTKKVALVGGKSLVPFRERPGQTKQRETIEKQWSEGHGGKLIGGKGRQEGWTTSAALLFWERFMRGGGGTWNLFSYDDDAVKELFRLFQSFRKQTPTWVFACLIRGGGGVWKKSSSKQLELEFPDGEQNAMLQCLTAGDKNSGSGSAPRGVLWDEFTKWKTEAKQDPTSMSEGWQDAPGNLFIIQFTGQGNEEGAKLFMDAYAGRGESGFVALFIPWLGHPDRTVNVADHEIDALKGSIGKERVYGPKDEMEMMNAGATLGEIRWRRRKLSGPGFQWNLSLFKREYPLCLTGDTLISTNLGIIPISEARDASYTESGPIERWIRREPSPIYKVTTKCGRVLRGTADHPIATPDGEFIDISELKVGDAIALRPPMFGCRTNLSWSSQKFVTNTIDVSERLGLFLGFFMGDGSYHHNTIDFACTAKDADVVEVVKGLVREFIGEPQTRNTSIYNGVPGCTSIRKSCSGHREAFIRLGMLRKVGDAWKRKVQVPPCIFEAPRDVVRQFLRGVFETDGSAGSCVSFASNKLKFAQDIQLLLLAFGITSTIETRKRQGSNRIEYVWYNLRMTRAESRAFVERIGFVGERKSRQRYEENSSGRPALPIVMQDEVASIVEDGIEETYDLTVRGSVFCANGILTHNCPSDMFISSSRTIFHDQEEILKSHVVPAEARHRAAVTGELRQGTQGEGWIVFDEYINGPWTIYEYPEDGCQYVFGADATSGKQVVAQGNGEPDYAFCTIDKLWTGETVACYRGHTEGRKFGNEVFNGAMFYNNARGFVESNTYGQAVIYRIMEMSFGPLNAVVEGRDLLMTHVQSISQRTGMASMIEEIGFTTGPKTKELLIDCIRAWLIEVGLYDPEKGATMPHQFVQEALLFERNPKTGGASARQGHDDAVMSKGLCLFAREETFRRGEVDVQTRVNRRPTLDPIEEFYRAVAKQNDTKRGKAGQSPHLGAAF